jgi:class 3 adenylate cyclase/predicted ATPase
MRFSDIIEQTKALLRRQGRITYRSLKREFDLEDEALEDLKFELIDGQELAVDKDGKMLVWKGAEGTPPPPSNVASPSPPPVSYTPPHLAERIRAEQAALEARSGIDGERKTITALFADLKGSTALIEGLDPEEARAIVDPALQLMMDAVHRYDGYVAQALGDGIFALFGAPLAHEDHPQRALYAALRMQEEMRRYADTLRAKGYPPLQMRVGVNTGEVVVRSIRKDDLHADYVPVGHSTNLAARMEQLATPGAIVVSAYTHRLTDGYFAFKDLGPTQIKGVEEPLHIYEVLGAGPLRTKLQVAARRGLTRFVGRQSEMAQLQHTLTQAKAGHGQIVGVVGEPGLGKSRLFHEFVGAYCNTPLLVLEAYSVSHGKASPYLPVIELLKSYFRIELPDDERVRREKVIGKVLGLDRSLEDSLPHLYALLGIEEQPSPLQQMDPQIRRRRTFEALKRLFLRESLNQPLTLVFEDLHWIDSETQGFLDTLSESVASAKLLLLTNYRPEYRHDWGTKTYYTQLRLIPLGKAEAEELLTFLLGADAGLKGLKQLILAKTEGTPFFMEEVVQTLAEEGVLVGERGRYRVESAPTALHISPTVQGVLAARIDRLGREEKELVHHLAVIGREFPLSLVRRVTPHPEEELYRLLSSLQHKEFLYEQPAFPDVEYIFKHALTQEVTYNSMLHERRKALHERTAQAVESLYRATLDDHYSELAHHYSRSGNTGKAIEYLQLAGQQSVQRSANAEAVRHFTTALELLKTFPDTVARARQELTLQTTLGTALSATQGFGSQERERVFDRARELCQQIGETPELFPVLWGLCQSHISQGKFQRALEEAGQLLQLAQRTQDPVLLLGAHETLGESLFWSGELTLALGHFEQGSVFSDPRQHRTLVSFYGIDPGILCQDLGAWTLWLLGYPDRARKRSHEALSMVRELAHPYSLGIALYFASLTHQLRQEAQLTQEHVEMQLRLTSEHGFPEWAAQGTILRGWALAEQGQGEEGIAQMRQGLAAYQATGSELARAQYLTLLAEAYGRRGQPEERLSTLAEASAVVDRTGERYWEAELYRLKGELLLAQEGKSQNAKGKSQKSAPPSPQPLTPSTQAEAEAEAYFHKAIEVARRQQAKSLELRAATSLARLWQQQGKRAEAHDLLVEIYQWFAEGFDTKDLQEAKALLDALS